MALRERRSGAMVRSWRRGGWSPRVARLVGATGSTESSGCFRTAFFGCGRACAQRSEMASCARCLRGDPAEGELRAALSLWGVSF